jgi:hypothetical protein
VLVGEFLLVVPGVVLCLGLPVPEGVLFPGFAGVCPGAAPPAVRFKGKLAVLLVSSTLPVSSWVLPWTSNLSRKGIGPVRVANVDKD